MACSHRDIADLLNRVRQPFNVSALALECAEAALGDEEYVRTSIEINDEGMEQLRRGLDQLGIAHIPLRRQFSLHRSSSADPRGRSTTRCCGWV